MKHPFIILLFIGLLALTRQVHPADRAVSLITSDDCPMETISALDIRKAYLGIRVSFDERPIEAFRLTSDEALNRVFFQSVVAMSEKTYERRRLLLFVKYGQPRPREFDAVDKLVAAVQSAPCSIAYVWEHKVAQDKGVKAIKVLWQEN
jgi:hypothetical protein